MIAVEKLSPVDIRSSAQSLLVFATNGIGMLVGHIVSGHVHEFFKLEDGGHAWAKIFLVPIAVTIIAGIAFILMFSEQRYQEDSAAIQQTTDATI
jgi:MFS family permease